MLLAGNNKFLLHRILSQIELHNYFLHFSVVLIVTVEGNQFVHNEIRDYLLLEGT